MIYLINLIFMMASTPRRGVSHTPKTGRGECRRHSIWITPCKRSAARGCAVLSTPTPKWVELLRSSQRRVHDTPSCASGLQGVIHIERLQRSPVPIQAIHNPPPPKTQKINHPHKKFHPPKNIFIFFLPPKSKKNTSQNFFLEKCLEFQKYLLPLQPEIR
jgi:hypothetical protein